MTNPPGHNVRVLRERVEDGYVLWGHCSCGHPMTAKTHDDLHVLINDHYDDARRLAALEQEEARR